MHEKFLSNNANILKVIKNNKETINTMQNIFVNLEKKIQVKGNAGSKNSGKNSKKVVKMKTQFELRLDESRPSDESRGPNSHSIISSQPHDKIRRKTTQRCTR